jgi:hypothetical protein
LAIVSSGSCSQRCRLLVNRIEALMSNPP